MKRFLLRKPENPPTEMPKRIRASTMATWFYCAEQYRHKALGLIPEEEEPKEALEVGTMLHKVIEETMGRRFPWEEEFMEKLAKFQDLELGFIRRIGDTKVYSDLTGHPDDLQINPSFIVNIIENKTTHNPAPWAIEKYKLPVAKFQASIYSWIFEPIFEKLGATCSGSNAAIFWNSKTFELIGWYHADYYPVQTEADIQRCYKAILDPSLIIPPKEWKCRYCPDNHKRICQFCQEKES